MAARDVYLLLETSEQVSTLGRHRVKGNQMKSKLRCQKMRRAICHRRRKLLPRKSCGSMKGRKKKGSSTRYAQWKMGETRVIQMRLPG